MKASGRWDTCKEKKREEEEEKKGDIPQTQVYQAKWDGWLMYPPYA